MARRSIAEVLAGHFGVECPAPAGGEGEPSLRFDKVALRFVEDLRSSLAGDVPAGNLLVVTVTAPIRQSSKTTAMLAEKARNLLAPKARTRRFTGAAEGNGIGASLVSCRLAGVSPVIGFVHNPDVGTEDVIRSVETLVARMAKAAR